MLREIIIIDEETCTGCGECMPNCPEGAIQLIDGKARLVSDLFCDGLGACIGHCPVGAISIEKREAEPYDERLVMENIVKAGDNVVKAHLEHLKGHGQDEFLQQAIEYLEEKGLENPLCGDAPPVEHACADSHQHAHPHFAGGCPGAMMRDFREEVSAPQHEITPTPSLKSELKTWPVQLHLLNPHAPYLKGADLVIASDCVAYAFPNFHQRFLKGKVLTILCPKLDSGMDRYVTKLTEIFKQQDIKSVTMVHMEVPCCFGLNQIVETALQKSGKNILLKEYTISVQGEII